MTSPFRLPPCGGCTSRDIDLFHARRELSVMAALVETGQIENGRLRDAVIELEGRVGKANPGRWETAL